MLHYLCCFCPDSSFSLSHFLGKQSSIYDKTNPDGAPNQNLRYDLRGVSASSQERTLRTIPGEKRKVLYYRLRPLVIWLERDALRKTLPLDFSKHCPNCVVIIDCFEIFLDRPLNLVARPQLICFEKKGDQNPKLYGQTL